MGGKAPFDFITNKTSHPLDRGWSWVVMLAAFGSQFIVIGYQRSFGLLFVAFQEKYGYSSALLSAVNGTQTLIYSFSTMLVMNYGLKKISIRTSCMVGALLQTIGIVTCSVYSDMASLIACQGFCVGLGHSMLYCPTILILSQYFDKRRSIATAVATCGAGAGGIAFPYITRFLLNVFGLQGALLILGALIFHQSVFYALFQPIIVEYADDSQLANDDLCRSKDDVNENNNTTTPYVVVVQAESEQNAKQQNNDQNYNEINNGLIAKSKSIGNGDDGGDDKSPSFISNQVNGKLSSSQIILSPVVGKSLIDDYKDKLFSSADGADGTAVSLLGEEGTTTTQLTTDKSCVPDVMRLPGFWVVAVYIIGGIVAAGCPALYIPPLSKEKGLTHAQATFFLTISGTMDSVGRIGSGLVLHFKLIGPCNLALIPLTLSTIFFNLTPLFNEFWSVLLLTLQYGFGSSMFWTLMSLVIIDVLGLANLGSAMGFYAVISGVTASASFPLAGWLYDETGSYSSSFHYFGSMSFLAALAILAIVIPRYRAKCMTLKCCRRGA